MPWPTYSERFILIATANVYAVYTVPEGRRVVVTSVFLLGNGVDTCAFQVDVNTTPVMMAVLPATTRMQNVECRIVYYAGEKVRATMNKVPGAITVCGYEFTDNSDPAGRPADLTYEPVLEVEQLPGGPLLGVSEPRR